MKNILGITLLTLSLTTNALTCTSMLNDGLKKIEITTLDSGASLLEINEDGALNYLLGTKTLNPFGFEQKYTAFNELGVEFTLSISTPIHHCRARVCNANPLSPKVGVLSSMGLDNEYFDCL
jgi:hypothetical protein